MCKGHSDETFIYVPGPSRSQLPRRKFPRLLNKRGSYLYDLREAEKRAGHVYLGLTEPAPLKLRGMMSTEDLPG